MKKFGGVPFVLNDIVATEDWGLIDFEEPLNFMQIKNKGPCRIEFSMKPSQINSFMVAPGETLVMNQIDQLIKSLSFRTKSYDTGYKSGLVTSGPSEFTIIGSYIRELKEIRAIDEPFEVSMN